MDGGSALLPNRKKVGGSLANPGNAPYICATAGEPGPDWGRPRGGKGRKIGSMDSKGEGGRGGALSGMMGAGMLLAAVAAAVLAWLSVT